MVCLMLSRSMSAALMLLIVVVAVANGPQDSQVVIDDINDITPYVCSEVMIDEPTLPTTCIDVYIVWSYTAFMDDLYAMHRQFPSSNIDFDHKGYMVNEGFNNITIHGVLYCRA